MSLNRLQSIFANKPELNFAVLVASIASIVVISSVIWTSFFAPTENSNPLPEKAGAVKITEKPALKTITGKTKPASQPPLPVSQNKLKPKQVVVGQGQLYVQVGAFKKPELARQMLKKMKTTYRRAEIVSKSGLYMVWVGPVASKEEALLLTKNIRKRSKIKGFITSKK